MKRFALNSAALVALAVGPAAAQVVSPDNVPGLTDTSSQIVQGGILAPISVVEGAGIKVGEGTVLHPIIGLETGFVSNVFFEENSPRAAGIMRLVAQIGTASLSQQRLTPANEGAATEQNVGSLQYRAELRASYDFYLSGSDTLSAQNGLGLGALFRGTVLPQNTWSFLYLEQFERIIRATNFESTERTNRDINRLALGLQFAPRGRSVKGVLRFENVIDYFEDENQQFANRVQNTVGLTVSWRFRPLTVFFADLAQGYFTGLGSDSRKVDSYPLTASVGTQTLLTLKSTLAARVGYQNGFYSTGQNFSAVMGGVQFGYRYTPTGRFTAMYEYGHQDSINANFFRDHTFRIGLEQQFAPFLLQVGPEARIRAYRGVMTLVPGPDTRNDLILAAIANLRYNFRDSFAALLEYRFSSVETDYVTGFGDDPSFVRHEILAAVRAAL